ncbi:MAG TPA: hydrogenase maturation protease [Pedococcus sp.]|jgi:hydrogenase maturation protease|uniref:hydrogenase maturation protease n=1 Tax=Pedococcus sp. TaxID=2860345 RepID=UPI002F94E24A
MSDGTGPGGVLVLGLGSPDRGDDAVGREVAGVVAALGLPGVAVIEHEDPTCVIEAWSGASAVVVVDAVRSGALPGSVTVLEVGADTAALPRSAWSQTGRGGTHAFGLASAVELSRALRRLPARLWVVGVEAAGLEHGAPLSAPVAASVPEAVRRVVGLVELASEVSASGGGCADVPR